MPRGTGQQAPHKELIHAMTKMTLTLLASAAIIGTGLSAPAAARAVAAPVPTAAEEAAVLDLAMKEIAIRSVRGEANRTPEVAALVRDRLSVPVSEG